MNSLEADRMQIWGITGGRRGNDVLVEGVAQALGGTFRLIHTDLRPPWTWLAPYRPAEAAAKADPNIAPPYPDLVIASARQAVPHARYLKRASGGRVFTAFLQNPLVDPKHFDFVWAPQHDNLSGANVMTTLLSPHAMQISGLQAEARNLMGRLLPSQPVGQVVTVLIGGPNAVYPFKQAEFMRLLDGLVPVAEAGNQLLITLSRRSPPHWQTLLRQKLPAGSYFLWDGPSAELGGLNPYRAMLGLADRIIVTGDSINMVGEACLPGVPVQVFALAGGSAKFRRFHEAILAEGHVRPFDGTLPGWQAHSLNATPQIADALAEAFARHQSGFGLS